MKKSIFLILLTAITIASCAKHEPNQGNELDKDNPRTEILLSKGGEAMVNNGNEFTINLFKELSKNNKENLLLNGFSINSTLSLYLNGLEGATADEIKAALNYGNMTQDEINENYKLLLDGLKKADKTTTLAIANSVWLRHDYVPNEEFKSIADNYFDSHVGLVDFSSATSCGEIRKWMSQKTNNLIPDYEFAPDVFLHHCVLNAMAFKGIWRTRFDESLTRDAVFMNYDKEPTMVKMMESQKDLSGYNLSEYYSFAVQAFGNCAFSMIFVLPEPGKNLNEVIEKFNYSQFLNEYANTDIGYRIKLPRYKISNEIELMPALQSLGITKIFNKKADNKDIRFDKIATNSVGELTDDLFVDRLRQKNEITVDEKGAEVKTVTEKLPEGYVTAAGVYDLNFNRPFLYMIMENSTKTILYIGKVTNL